MELKPDSFEIDLAQFIRLLIVPYGIETMLVTSSVVPHGLLLIVPYGIETCIIKTITGSNNLLIVPYGIET